MHTVQPVLADLHMETVVLSTFTASLSRKTFCHWSKAKAERCRTSLRNCGGEKKALKGNAAEFVALKHAVAVPSDAGAACSSPFNTLKTLISASCLSHASEPGHRCTEGLLKKHGCRRRGGDVTRSLLPDNFCILSERHLLMRKANQRPKTRW